MEGTRASRLQSVLESLSVGFDQFTFRIKAQTRDMERLVRSANLANLHVSPMHNKLRYKNRTSACGSVNKPRTTKGQCSS
jgi:hypothetical protein